MRCFSQLQPGQAQKNLLRNPSLKAQLGPPLSYKAIGCPAGSRSYLRFAGTQACKQQVETELCSSTPPLPASLSSQGCGSDFQQYIQQGLSRAIGSLIALSISFTGVPIGELPAEAKLTADEEATIKVFNTSKPSVVSVTNLALRRDAFTMNMMEFPQGVGSGFVWDEEGHVVTNYHVINDSANVKVTLGTDDLLATVVGVDPDKDVAVLQVLPATVSQDPMINTKKDPKSVGGRLDEMLLMPAMSDTDVELVSNRALSSASNSSSSFYSNVALDGSRAGMASTSGSSGWAGSSETGSRDGDGRGLPAWDTVAEPLTVSKMEGSGGDGVPSRSEKEARMMETLTLPGANVPEDPQVPALKRPPTMPDGQPSTLVKIPEAMETMRPLCLASSKNLQVGQRVYAVGNPFGLDHTLTMGVVSGTGREIQSLNGRPINEVIQTDAAINPGNSGGPLLDSSGCVIGITTAIYSNSGQNSGVGFAIPTDTVRTSVEQILKYGKVVRPIVGISFAPDQASEQLGVRGIMVLNAVEGGPAWKAGIQGTSRDEFGRLVLGDIIRAANGEAVRSSSDLYKQLDKSKVGDKIDLEVLRGSSIQHVEVTLEANTTPPSQSVIIIQPKVVPMPSP